MPGELGPCPDLGLSLGPRPDLGLSLGPRPGLGVHSFLVLVSDWNLSSIFGFAMS